MSKQVIFRDRQEVQDADLNNVGAFAAESMDRIVREGVTDERKFSGFAVAKTGTTEVTISPGTYWSNGKRFIREAAHTIDFLSQLPLVTKRIAAIIVTGQTIETDVQPRDFIIDVESGATEPDSVAMQALRYAEFQVALGSESPTPQKPIIPSDVIAVAWITLSTSGVDATEKAVENEIMSNKRLAARATALEVWRREAGEQITTLGSDIATLATAVGRMTGRDVLTGIFEDLAVIKDQLDLEDGYSGYGAENFLAEDQSISDPAATGYYASVSEGLRPPADNAASTSLQLFNPLDPGVKVASDGTCLPRYHEVRRLSLDSYQQQLSLAQYEFQQVAYKTLRKSATRLRFGLAFTICRNGRFWNSGTFDVRAGIFTDALGRTYQALDTNFTNRFEQEGRTQRPKNLRLQEFWYDEEVDYYEKRVATDHTVQGAVVAQTFLNTQGGWLTSLDLYFTQVAATGDLRVLICRTAGGQPDMSQAIAETTVAAGSLVQGTSPASAEEWTRIPFVPTALEAGERYAIVLITGGDHYVGLTSGENYAAGTLFSSTDGAFFKGDLTLDLMMRTNFASFEAARAEIDLSSLNLSGGINDLDIAFEGIAPDGTELHFEVRPQGSSRWHRIDGGVDNPFNGLPALVNLRAVFVGTKDLMPGFRLTGSNVTVSRPATTMQWHSLPISLPAASDDIKVIVTLDHFNEANHDFALVIDDLTNSETGIAPDTVVDHVLDERDGTRKRIRREMTWGSGEFPVATSEVKLVATGTLTAATEMYHVERLVWMSF